MNKTDYIQLATLALVAVSLVLNSRAVLRAVTKRTRRSVILDSCALIDGRITELAQAGFVPETIIIPAFILKELQLLADGSDAHKRERARYGLDVAKNLKDLARVDVVIDRQNFESKRQIDDKLIALAMQTGAQLYTTDYNLAKVAEVEGVQVLNVNELAQNLKQNVLPGEKLSIKIIQKGSNKGQGVGYADDGTMVVVDHADRMMGRVIDVTVDRMIGTMAGKMIFAKYKPTSVKRKAAPKESGYITDLRKELN